MGDALADVGFMLFVGQGAGGGACRVEVVGDVVAVVNGFPDFPDVAGLVLALHGHQHHLALEVVEDNDVFIDSNNVRNYLVRGAKRDAALSYPNREWGYGRLDLYHTFEVIS